MLFANSLLVILTIIAAMYKPHSGPLKALRRAALLNNVQLEGNV